MELDMNREDLNAVQWFTMNAFVFNFIVFLAVL